MPPGADETRQLLRFLTCGSVDDGKSTLIGRLLFDGRQIMDDTLTALTRDSRQHGTTGEDVDLALLMDGLEAERQQGITIDVAYRYFSSPRRSFIVADTPGHEQYTRNMATGASTSDVAVILVDARKGVLQQTRRHAFICSLFGIRDVVLAVNKMDVVSYDREVFDRIAADFSAFTSGLRFRSVQAIPISAKLGENVWTRGESTSWYEGPHLLSYLETIDVSEDLTEAALRFPVQWVNRPNQDFRGFAGTIASGRVRTGDAVVVAASGRIANVSSILAPDGERSEAVAGEAIVVTLDREIDVSRGDMLVTPQERPTMTDQFAAHVLWMDDAPLLAGRQYLMRIGNLWTPASVTTIKHRVDVNSLEHAAARALQLNEIGLCNIATAQRVPIDPYADMRATGAFILVDRLTNRTAGVGLVDFSLRRAENTYLEASVISKAARASRNGQRPVALWLTGLSGAGKSTIARAIEGLLFEEGKRAYVLDGDNLRHGLNHDLGFTDADRVENIRRAGEVAKLFVDAGLIAICSFISPFRAERDTVRGLFEDDEFVEIFVDTPLDECVKRDPKGLYAKALAGKIRNFTGLDSPYQPPENPELRIQTVGHSAGEAAHSIVSWLRASGRLD